jgi:hypothetical protein
MLRRAISKLSPSVSGMITHASCRYFKSNDDRLQYDHKYRLQDKEEDKDKDPGKEKKPHYYQLRWQASPKLEFAPGTHVSFDYTIRTNGKWDFLQITSGTMKLCNNSYISSTNSNFHDVHSSIPLAAEKNNSSLFHKTGKISSCRTISLDVDNEVNQDNNNILNTTPTTTSTAILQYIHVYCINGDHTQEYDVRNQRNEVPMYGIGTSVEFQHSECHVYGRIFYEIDPQTLRKI